MSLHLPLLVTSVLGAIAVMVWRLRETSRPVNARRIVIPPLGMSTGFCMFFFPPTRIPLAWGLTAFALGLLVLSYPLIKTSTLRREGELVLLQRSKAFLWVIIGLFAVRFGARAYVERYVSPLQTGAIFFVLAFGMILRWRIAMYLQYRKLVAPSAQA